VLKDEKQLREFVECFVIVAEDGTMTVLREVLLQSPWIVETRISDRSSSLQI